LLCDQQREATVAPKVEDLPRASGPSISTSGGPNVACATLARDALSRNETGRVSRLACIVPFGTTIYFRSFFTLDRHFEAISMFHCIIWRDETKADGKYYSLLDPLTREPLLGENGQQLIDLSFKQAMNAMDRFEELTGQQMNQALEDLPRDVKKSRLSGASRGSER
jgi:hypothetical protein